MVVGPSLYFNCQYVCTCVPEFVFLQVVLIPYFSFASVALFTGVLTGITHPCTCVIFILWTVDIH